MFDNDAAIVTDAGKSTAAAVGVALNAAELRALIDQRVDTGAHGPERVAQNVLAWATGEGAAP